MVFKPCRSSKIKRLKFGRSSDAVKFRFCSRLIVRLQKKLLKLCLLENRSLGERNEDCRIRIRKGKEWMRGGGWGNSGCRNEKRGARERGPAVEEENGRRRRKVKGKRWTETGVLEQERKGGRRRRGEGKRERWMETGVLEQERKGEEGGVVRWRKNRKWRENK